MDERRRKGKVGSDDGTERQMEDREGEGGHGRIERGRKDRRIGREEGHRRTERDEAGQRTEGERK